MTDRIPCPSCGTAVGMPFYELPAVPTNSCLLVKERDAALDFPVAPLRLAFCSECGFVFNSAWQPARTNYSEDYEETQSFSETFNTFQERLVRDLVARHDLNGKRVVEIGCGKGEFLCLLCRLGNNAGLGYDPSFVPARGDAGAANFRVVREFFDETTGPLACDFLCCKMTLEHIFNVGQFLATIRRSLDASANTVLFFQVPDAGRILRELAFWDIYYEHCSYFTAGSLRNLFERSGFAVDRTWTDYDGQYLMIEARPAGRMRHASGSAEDVREVAAEIERFGAEATAAIAAWRERLAAAHASGRRILVWGSGSKAVAFLTTVGVGHEVTAVVDVNPFRQGCFMPATGHPIIAPEQAAAAAPDLVVVMNPIYSREIARSLQSYGCHPEMLAV